MQPNVNFDFFCSYTTSGRESRNIYNFVAATDDNNAVYRCDAKNHMNVEPMSAEIKMSVQCKKSIQKDVHFNL